MGSWTVEPPPPTPLTDHAHSTHTAHPPLYTSPTPYPARGGLEGEGSRSMGRSRARGVGLGSVPSGLEVGPGIDGDVDIVADHVPKAEDLVLHVVAAAAA